MEGKRWSGGTTIVHHPGAGLASETRDKLANQRSDRNVSLANRSQQGEPAAN